MNVKIDKSFIKSLDKFSFDDLKLKIEKILSELEKAKSLKDVRQIKKMQGFKAYYRIKAGDYRIGLELLDAETISLIIVAHRKDIYKRFP